MTEVNITELRQRLPSYLARAAQGEQVRVTNRGKVIAEIGPPACRTEHPDQARARLSGSVLCFDEPFEPVLDPSRWAGGR